MLRDLVSLQMLAVRSLISPRPFFKQSLGDPKRNFLYWGGAENSLWTSRVILILHNKGDQHFAGRVVYRCVT